MLRKFIYFTFIVCCKCEIILTPFSVANPFGIANELAQHKVDLAKSYKKEIQSDPLDVLFYILNNTPMTSNISSDQCAISLEIFRKDLLSNKEYAVKSKL